MQWVRVQGLCGEANRNMSSLCRKIFFPQHADMEEIITGFRHKNVGYEMHYQVLELGINIIETNKDLMNKYCKIEVTN